MVVDYRCGRCGAVLSGSANYCSCCGCPTGKSTDLMVAEIVDDGESWAVIPPRYMTSLSTRGMPRGGPLSATSDLTVHSLLHNRPLIVVLLLCLGPLALPLLWISPRFSRRCKLVTTVVFFLVTVVMPLLLAWYVFEIVLRPLADTLS